VAGVGDVKERGATPAPIEHWQDRASWSTARLSAAVSATRFGAESAANERSLGDEIDFFVEKGSRRHVQAGAPLVRRGSPMEEVHLVARGAVAVLGDHDGRRPILQFVLPNEVCCAIPALLRQAAPWDAVAVTDAALIALPADVFTAAVQERWVERWSNRTLTWLAGVGSRVADLDQPEPVGQVAALLLRARGESSAEQCRRTIADLLDLDDATVRDALARLTNIGAVELSDGRISIARADKLRRVVAGDPLRSSGEAVRDNG
jgi:CRP-like cAMP-binding protein